MYIADLLSRNYIQRAENLVDRIENNFIKINYDVLNWEKLNTNFYNNNLVLFKPIRRDN